MQAPASRRKRPLCGSNLEAHGQNARLRMGLGMLAMALALSVVLVRADIDRLWRLALAVPFFFSAMGAFQGLYRTCPGMVMKGARELPAGREERVADPEELAASRRLAFRVTLASAGTALAATGLVMLIP